MVTRDFTCRKCPKKVSAATFSCNGEHAIFADKFGDVYVAATAAPEQVMFPGYDCLPEQAMFRTRSDRPASISINI